MPNRITPGHWFAIGVYSGSSPLTLAPTPGVKNPVLSYRDVTDIPAVFLADPFMIRHEDLWYMFFEIFNQETYKGDLGVAVSEDARSWEYRGVVMVEPFNLSYPHVFRWRGEIYMTPEMYGQECVRLYRAEAFPYDWRPVADLITDGPVADPTPFRHDDSWWLFTCPRPRDHDALRLYRADRLMGPWQEHPASPIVTDDPRRARPAGRVAAGDRGLIRFAQYCYPRYGSSVRAFEITRLTATEYVEQPVPEPPIAVPEQGAWNSCAMHHVDAHRLDDGSWLALIDGHDHPSHRRSGA